MENNSVDVELIIADEDSEMITRLIEIWETLPKNFPTNNYKH